MSADEFFRLDPEIQEDIIHNYMLGQQEHTPPVDNNGDNPHNSPI